MSSERNSMAKGFASGKCRDDGESMNTFGRVLNLSSVRSLTRMPKNKQQKGGDQKSIKKEKSSIEQQQHSPVTNGKDGIIMIAIQVKPGAKKDAISFDGDTVGVQISAPPVDGEANTAIIKYFAEVLKVKKSEIDLKGGKSRQKTLMIQPGSLTVSQCISLLEQESSGS